MPGLMTTIGANASQGKAELKSFGDSAQATAQRTIRALEESEAGYVREKMALQGLGVEYEKLSAKIDAIRNKKAQLRSTYNISDEKNYSESKSQNTFENPRANNVNSPAYEQLLMERKAAAAEKTAYNAYLETNANQLSTVTDASKAENDALLVKSQALKEEIALRKSAAAEASRYGNAVSQSGSRNMRAENSADDASWQAKLANYRDQKSGSIPENLRGLTKEAPAAKAAMAGVGSAAGGAHGKITGLSGSIRELLVMMHEGTRGDWKRMIGSASIELQNLTATGAFNKPFAFLTKDVGSFFGFGKKAGEATVSGFAGALASIPILMVLTVTAAIGGIIGGIAIYFHRLKAQTESLLGPMREIFKTEHIGKFLQKVNILSQLQKDLTDEVRSTQEAYNSVNETIDRALELTKDRIAFETELLEIQKANELAAAKTAKEREAIEKKYSAQILSKKKEERDAELQAMRDKAANLPAEMQKDAAEIKKLTGPGYYTEHADQEILKSRQASSAVFDEYRKQLMPGQKDERKYSADKDRETIAKINEKDAGAEANGKVFTIRTGKMERRGLSDADQADRAAAQKRLSESASTEQSVKDWQDSADPRNRARSRVKELEEKIKADQKKLTELGTDAHGQIADKLKANIQKDSEEKRLAEERLKRTDNPNQKGRHSDEHLNAMQKIGAFTAGGGGELLTVTRRMEHHLSILVASSRRAPAAHRASGIPRTQY